MKRPANEERCHEGCQGGFDNAEALAFARRGNCCKNRGLNAGEPHEEPANDEEAFKG